MSNENDLLTTKKVAELLDCSIRTVQRLREAGVITPVTCFKRLVKYRAGPIYKLIEAQEGGANDDKETQ